MTFMTTVTVPSRRPRVLTVSIVMALSLGFGLAACSSGSSATPSTVSVAEDAAVDESVTFERAWGKATDGPMTGVFGTLTNHTDEDLTLESAASPVADLVELHETVMVDGQMKMREIEGGFVIPANGTRELAPGEDHIMLMELTEELLPGQLLPITLTFSDGTVLELELDIREYAGANEAYADLEHHDDHGGHGDHGDHDDYDEHGEEGEE